MILLMVFLFNSFCVLTACFFSGIFFLYFLCTTFVCEVFFVMSMLIGMRYVSYTKKSDGKPVTGRELFFVEDFPDGRGEGQKPVLFRGYGGSRVPGCFLYLTDFDRIFPDGVLLGGNYDLSFDQYGRLSSARLVV